jgi:hypothetical protein
MLTSVTAPYDFRLKTGSPAINAGVTLVEVPVDINGNVRSDGLYDLGAHEGTAASQPTPTVATPTISPNGGVVTGPIAVTLATTTAGATIRYTLDGTTPGSTSPVYTGPFTVDRALTVKAKASAAGMIDSPVAQATFQAAATPTVAAPTISPNGGIVTGPIPVTLGTTTAGATIRYTLDGTTPGSTSPVYTGPFTVDRALTVKAKASAAGMTDSPVAQAVFQAAAPADTTRPTISITSPQNGARVSRWVTISAAASDSSGIASVQFFVDNQAIATDSSAPYSVSWSFRKASAGAHVIKAVATDKAGNTAQASITVYR